MAQHNHTGKQGEHIAARFLRNKGFEILARNYRHKNAEIDLITRFADTVVFVEVKTRKNSAFGCPEQFLSDAQIDRILDAATHFQEHFFSEEQMRRLSVRFDLISILGIPPKVTLEHFEDAFF